MDYAELGGAVSRQTSKGGDNAEAQTFMQCWRQKPGVEGTAQFGQFSINT